MCALHTECALSLIVTSPSQRMYPPPHSACILLLIVHVQSSLYRMCSLSLYRICSLSRTRLIEYE
jgi:hypothetical protein